MTEKTKPWRDPELTLGQRCNVIAEHEMARGVKAAPYGQSNTSEDVRVYLAGCVRNLDEDPELEPLGLTAGNWCAAFASWCLEQCILPGETRPHHWRAGVVEIVADAQARGLWHTAQEARSGLWAPSVGDLCIWDRSEPGRPETAWWRHVNRLVEYDPREETLVTIGGNEGRTIRKTDEAPKGLDHSKLLGFVSYHQPRRDLVLTSEEREDQLRLVAMFVEQHRREISA